MDSRSDPFWRANRGLPFPSVAEAVEQELASCKKREAQIRSAGSSGDGGGDPNLEDNTSRIKDAVSSLPQLLEQKRQLTGHMSLLMAVMDKIKEGKVRTSERPTIHCLHTDNCPRHVYTARFILLTGRGDFELNDPNRVSVRGGEGRWIRGG